MVLGLLLDGPTFSLVEGGYATYELGPYSELSPLLLPVLVLYLCSTLELAGNGCWALSQESDYGTRDD